MKATLAKPTIKKLKQQYKNKISSLNDEYEKIDVFILKPYPEWMAAMQSAERIEKKIDEIQKRLSLIEYCEKNKLTIVIEPEDLDLLGE